MASALQNLSRHLRGLGIDGLVTITAADADRVYGWPSPRLREFLRLNGWQRDPRPFAEYFHGEGSESFREPDGHHPALQIVFHPFKAGEWVELDLDKSAPFVDVLDTAAHVGEVIANWARREKTDQAEIARMLDRRWVKEAHA